jgi:coenzyme PQQ precursor peptide PqqA
VNALASFRFALSQNGDQLRSVFTSRRATPAASQQNDYSRFTIKNFAGELSISRYLINQDGWRPLARKPTMAWKAPKIVEVPVGMEINMYACAARK